MATEYIDGTFSETMPFNEALRHFKEQAETGLVRSLHIGTKQEIEEVKRKKDIQKRVDDIESKLNALKAKEDVKNSNIVEPTKEQIELVEKLKNRIK